MISLESATWASQAVTVPAIVRTDPQTTPDERERRRRPAMVIRRPTADDAVEVGPADATHPAGRVDIYL
ncbi:hypothetical protein [Kineococcus rhizosphaerae]|uniref:Uncharacterized protein n=1 Tax=Kineococcus rhizosphaerae TaxID=559628 RepID=A0A2T0RBB8_9ACTN|nr:hypothetical protein [Kineococcus rhizosphaerae]PRY18464.1 hypothetical protein CLV37_101709 [Kineococcus rhizosphaerae]